MGCTTSAALLPGRRRSPRALVSRRLEADDKEEVGSRLVAQALEAPGREVSGEAADLDGAMPAGLGDRYLEVLTSSNARVDAKGTRLERPEPTLTLTSPLASAWIGAVPCPQRET
jgi:hypothetical protein